MWYMVLILFVEWDYVWLKLLDYYLPGLLWRFSGSCGVIAANEAIAFAVSCARRDWQGEYDAVAS